MQLARSELAQLRSGAHSATPVPDFTDGDTADLARLARRAWSLVPRSGSRELSRVLASFRTERTGLDRRLSRATQSIQQTIDQVYVSTASTLRIAPLSGDCSVDRAGRGRRCRGRRRRRRRGGAARRNGLGHAGLLARRRRLWPRMPASLPGSAPSPPGVLDLPTRSPGMWSKRGTCRRTSRHRGNSGHPEYLLSVTAQLLPPHPRAAIQELRSSSSAPASGCCSDPPKAPTLAARDAVHEDSVWVCIHAFQWRYPLPRPSDYIAPKLACPAPRSPNERATRSARSAGAPAQQALVELGLSSRIKRVAPLWNRSSTMASSSTSHRTTTQVLAKGSPRRAVRGQVRLGTPCTFSWPQLPAVPPTRTRHRPPRWDGSVERSSHARPREADWVESALAPPQSAARARTRDSCCRLAPDGRHARGGLPDSSRGRSTCCSTGIAAKAGAHLAPRRAARQDRRHDRAQACGGCEAPSRTTYATQRSRR